MIAADLRWLYQILLLMQFIPISMKSKVEQRRREELDYTTQPGRGLMLNLITVLAYNLTFM